MKKPSVVISLDIEARGQGPKRHGIMAIGVCVGSMAEEKVLEKVRYDIKPLPNQSLEKRCWDTFWCKHKDNFNLFTANAKEAKGQITAFRALLDKWHKQSDTVYIVSDNPGFDFGMINYYLDYFSLPTLNYAHNGNYTNTHDADSYGRGVMKQGFESQWFSNSQACAHFKLDLDPEDHDHMPENDAEFIYRLHFQVVNKNKK